MARSKALEDRMQEDIAVDMALHENLGLPLLHKARTFPGALLLGGGIDEGNLPPDPFCRQHRPDFLLVADQNGGHQPFLDQKTDALEDAVVRGVHNGHCERRALSRLFQKRLEVARDHGRSQWPLWTPRTTASSRASVFWSRNG